MPTVVLTLLLNVAGFAIIYAVCIRRINRALSPTEVIESIRDEVHSLVLELNQTTDRNVSLTEERMKRLQQLLGEADRKIQLLSRETDKQRFGLDVYNRLKESSAESRIASSDPSPTEEVSETDGTLTDRVIRLAHQGFDTRIIAQKLGTTRGEVELILSLRHGRKA